MKDTDAGPGAAFRLVGIALNVSDLERSRAFYEHALGFACAGPVKTATPQQARLLGAPFHSQQMRIGNSHLELTMFDGPTMPYPLDSRANDLWFQHFALLCLDVHAALLSLCDHDITPISQGGPQTLPPHNGGITAYKFRDPDGHPLELFSLPNKPCHDQTKKGLFYGIDHSAISIRSTEASILFYKKHVGLNIQDRQCNKGPRQDHLDGLHDVTVQVTALADKNPGMHLELLDYKKPPGRTQGVPTHPTERAASRLVFRAEDTSATPRSAPRHNDHPDALLRDPDGHYLLLLQDV